MKKLIIKTTFVLWFLFICLFINEKSYADDTEYEYIINNDGTISLTKYIGDESQVEVPVEIDGKKVTCINEHCFSGNYKIRYLIIPETVNKIGRVAFASCKNLKQVDIYGNLEDLGERIFYECRDLELVSFYGELCYLPNETFSDCENLEYVYISKSCEYIGYACFMFCPDLEAVPLPENLLRVERYGLGSSDNVLFIDFPENMEYISRDAWRCYSEMISICIPESLFEQEGLVDKINKINVKYSNTKGELKQIDAPKLFLAIYDYMLSMGYKAEDIDMRNAVENSVGVRVYCKTSPEEMYYVCANQDEYGNPDIFYTRKIDIFEYEKGDVNRDLKIDAGDALEILKYSAGLVDLSYANMRIGDFDSNGNATPRDALTLLKYVAGFTETL